jgi:hypothetical protein
MSKPGGETNTKPMDLKGLLTAVESIENFPLSMVKLPRNPHT